jgi:putative transposase
MAQMGRPLRKAAGGLIYHVWNRANGNLQIFDDETDYATFEKALTQAVERTGMRLLAWCFMPNHWHLVLWPRKEGDLSEFMRWLSLTHTQRWHSRRRDAGSGHLYQGRFKSFPVQEDNHFLTIVRHIERNPLRAKLVKRAEKWRWSSLWAWKNDSAEDLPPTSPWPLRRPGSWAESVNARPAPQDAEAVAISIKRSRPFGEPAWQKRTADRLGLKMTLNPRGRPPKARTAGKAKKTGS